MLPSQRPFSGFAAIGFYLSLVLCLPPISIPAGLVFGALGLIQTTFFNRTGRKYALAAILISLTWLGVCAVGVSYLLDRYTKPFSTLTTFSIALKDNNPAAASALLAPDYQGPPPEELIARLRPLGRYESLGPDPSNTTFPFSSSTTPTGQPTRSYSGPFHFANGTATLDLEIRRTPQGWRISRFLLLSISPLPTTQPASRPNLP